MDREELRIAPPPEKPVITRDYDLGFKKILSYDGTRAVRSIVKIYYLLGEVVNTGHSVPSAEKIRRVQNNRNGGNAMLIPPYVLEFVVKRSRNMCAMTGLNIFPLNVWEEGVRRTGEEVVGCQSNVQHDANSLKRTYSHIHLFTYSLHKKAAFTLAEVLITLGIIGIGRGLNNIRNYRRGCGNDYAFFNSKLPEKTNCS